MRKLLIALMLATPAVAGAADLQINIEVPRLDVAEYHRPYVAVWVEREDGTVVGDIAHWYQQPGGGKKEDGTKWLKDIRQWWRRSGRTQQFPVDGVSGATKPVGKHRISLSDAKPPLAGLAPGNYRVVVEAAREVGGRELLKLDFAWPPKAAAHAEAKGAHELGAISIDLTP